MKGKIFSLLLVCSIVVLLNSCETQNPEKVDNLLTRKEANFTASITKLRATGNQWEEDDEIGLYALKGEPSTSLEIYDEKENISFFTSTGDGKFTATNRKIYYPNVGTLSFIAYYPYQEDIIDGNYEIDLSEQEKLGDIDLLYSDNATGLSSEDNDIELNFDHMLSKVTFNIVAGENLESLDSLEATIDDFYTEGTFNILSKEINIEENSKNSLELDLNIDSENKKASTNVILIPGQNMKDTNIVFNLDGKKIEWTPEDKTLASGKHYSYKISLSNKDAMEIDNTTIKDWEHEEEDEISLVVDPENLYDENDSEKNGELLFIGSDFENSEEFEASKNENSLVISPFLPVLKPGAGQNNSQALHMSGEISKNLNLYMANIDEAKLKAPYEQITFYLKGESDKAITVILSTAGRGIKAYFNIDDTSIKNPIKCTGTRDYENNVGKVNTKGKWKKVTLDISDLPVDTQVTKRNALSIIVMINEKFDFLIDNFRVK